MRLFLFLLLFAQNLYSADFNLSFPHTIKVEGERFTRIKLDRGGATKYGVTIVTYTFWCNGKKITIVVCDKNNDGKITAIDLNRTTIEDVKPIYKALYWDVAKGDQIKNQAIAEFITDFFINSGASTRNIKLIQKCLKIKEDGIFGTKTLKAINSKNPKKLFKVLLAFRTKFFENIVKRNPSQKVFLKGWKNRLKLLTTIYKNEKLL